MIYAHSSGTAQAACAMPVAARQLQLLWLMMLWRLEIKVLVLGVSCVTLGKCFHLSGLGEFIFKRIMSGNFLNLTKDTCKKHMTPCQG